MITVEVQDYASPFLLEVAARIRGNQAWAKPLGRAGDCLRRFAVGISPVVTGSYADAHRAVVSGKTVTLSIDPTARNTATGQPVTAYAGAVEKRHRVYGRAFAQAPRIAAGILEDLAKEFGL